MSCETLPLSSLMSVFLRYGAAGADGPLLNRGTMYFTGWDFSNVFVGKRRQSPGSYMPFEQKCMFK